MRRSERVLDDQRLFALAYHGPTNTLYTGTLDGELFRFKLLEGKLSQPGQVIYQLFDHDIVDKDTGEPYLTASIYNLELRRLASQTDRLFLSSLSHSVVALDVIDGTASEAWRYAHDDALYAMDVSSDGKTVIVTDSNGRIVVLDGDTGKLVNEVLSYAIDPASSAKQLVGELRLARPDTLANVGLDVHPSGQYFAVSSHDRTTKLFETATGTPLAAIVHDRLARNVTFDTAGEIAYSYSDDGVIQRSFPFESYESVRLGGIDRLFLSSRNEIVIVVDQNETVFRLDTTDASKIRAVAGLPDEHSQFIDIPGLSNSYAAYDLDQQRVFAYSISSDDASARLLCQGRSIDELLALSDAETIDELSHGPEPGELLVSIKNLETDRYQPRRVNVSLCQETSTIAFPSGRETIMTATSGSAIAIRSTPNIVNIWHTKVPDSDPTAEIHFSHAVESFAVGMDGRSILVWMSDSEDVSEQSSSLCYCHETAGIGALMRHLINPSGCGVSEDNLSCSLVALPERWDAQLVRDVHSSPAGSHFIVRNNKAALAALSLPAWPLSRPRLIPISPAQNRPIGAPFAFDAAERYIAVPSGDTGFRILDTEIWQTQSSLPTPGRVYRLGFIGSDAFNIDGANEDSILRIQPWTPESLIVRACDYWPTATTPQSRTGVPITQNRSAFCINTRAAQ